jgi:protein TonB
MFANSCNLARNDRRDRKRAWILTSSIVLHGAALATLAGIQVWQVEAVAEPPTADVFQVLLPPPLPPSEPATTGRHQEESKRPLLRQTAATPVPHTAAVTQPDLEAPPMRHAPPLDSGPPTADVPAATADPNVSGDGDREISGPPGDGDGGESRSGRALPIGGPISRPQIVPGTKVQPHYTELARQAHLQGTVVLEATIDERGNVVDVHVLKPLKMGLDLEAVKAVSQWKFTPALLHGRPVKVYFDLTVQFEVR